MNQQPFSIGWVIASVVIFTVLEIGIAVGIAPLIFASALATEPARLQLQAILHLGSFYLGGVLVGIISPRVRMLEPAVGAFVAVAIVFLMSLFVPMTWMQWEWHKILIGGGIAFALALMGAYTGEKIMGNIPVDGARAQLRDKLWGDTGVLSRGDPRFLASSSSRSTRTP